MAYIVMVYIVMACAVMAYIANYGHGPVPLWPIELLLLVGVDPGGQPMAQACGHVDSVCHHVRRHDRDCRPMAIFGDFRGMPTANAEG